MLIHVTSNCLCTSNTYVSGKLLCLALQSSFNQNERWGRKQVSGPLRQGPSNQAGHAGSCMTLQCFYLTQVIKESKVVECL